MSALRIEKQLGRILDFSHKEHSRVARKHGIKTTILPIKFNVKFDHAELDEVDGSMMSGV